MSGFDDTKFDGPVAGILRIALATAVPLWIHELQGLSPDARAALAGECAQVVAEKGDVLQFRGEKRGETARAFNALAKGLACLAFAPGGVTFLGDHWAVTATERRTEVAT